MIDREQVKLILGRALELSDEDRAAYVAEACGDDATPFPCIHEVQEGCLLQ